MLSHITFHQVQGQLQLSYYIVVVVLNYTCQNVGRRLLDDLTNDVFQFVD